MNLSFHPYGLIVGLGILAGFQASIWLAKKRKIPVQLIEGLFWWAIGGGIIGARLYHVIDKWQEIYSVDPKMALFVWNGGLGIWGAVIGGMAGLWLGKRFFDFAQNDNIQKVKLVDLLDVGTFGLPLGQAIGRWGNYFNNEIVGKNGEPLFFYESVLNLVLFGILVKLVKLDKFGKNSGTITGVYLIGYGLIRFILEPLRPEAMVWKIGGLPTAVWVSGVSILIGIFFFFRKSNKERAN